LTDRLMGPGDEIRPRLLAVDPLLKALDLSNKMFNERVHVDITALAYLHPPLLQ